MDGFRTLALVDTGAAVSVIDVKLCRLLRKVTTTSTGLSLRTASAHHIQPLAACTARVIIQDVVYPIEFLVLPACSHDVILGWDFLSRHHAVIDCARAEVAFSALCSASSAPTTEKLFVADDTNIPPSSTVLVPVSCAAVRESTVLFTPSETVQHRRNLTLPFALLDMTNGGTALFVTNPLPVPSTLLRGECIGTIQASDVSSIFCLDDVANLHLSALTPSASAPDRPPLSTFGSAIDDELAEAHREKLLALLHQFRGSFDCQKTSLGRTHTVLHPIDTGSHAPLRQRPYRVSPAERRVIAEQVDDMLQRGIIQPSCSPWSSPVVLVKKKMAQSASASITAV